MAERRASPTDFVPTRLSFLPDPSRRGIALPVPIVPRTPRVRTAAMHDEFHRIRRLPPYVFAEVNKAKAAARAAGEDIIDLGMGNPDSPTPPHIVAKLVEAVQDPRTHRYSVSKGIQFAPRAEQGRVGEGHLGFY